MRPHILLACLGMTLMTYLCRALFTVSVSRVRISRWWENYLTFIPFAVLTALVTPYLIVSGPGVMPSLVNPYSLAGCATFALSFRTRNLVLSVLGGMVLFWVLGGIM